MIWREGQGRVNFGIPVFSRRKEAGDGVGAGDEAENWNLDMLSLTWRIKLENGCGREWV